MPGLRLDQSMEPLEALYKYVTDNHAEKAVAKWLLLSMGDRRIHSFSYHNSHLFRNEYSLIAGKKSLV
jgi:hypothetical protein